MSICWPHLYKQVNENDKNYITRQTHTRTYVRTRPFINSYLFPICSFANKQTKVKRCFCIIGDTNTTNSNTIAYKQEYLHSYLLINTYSISCHTNAAKVNILAIKISHKKFFHLNKRYVCSADFSFSNFLFILLIFFFREFFAIQHHQTYTGNQSWTFTFSVILASVTLPEICY